MYAPLFKFVEAEHPRDPEGKPTGGQFVDTDGG